MGVLTVHALLALVLAAPCPSLVTYPGAEWPSQVDATRTAKATQIKALEDYAFDLKLPDSSRDGVRTDGIVIIKGGALIYEKYARGFTPEKRHLAWSVTKTVVNALVGIGVQRGDFSIDDGLCKHKAFDAPEACARLKLRHLLEFSSGLDWKETYENADDIQYSSIAAMLYGEGRRDMATWVARHRFRDEPGTTYEYSSGDSTLLTAAIGGAFEPALGHDWPWKLLFDPIGMKSAVFEADPKGTYVGSSYLWATPRDMARFGYLYLRDGCWNGERLLPETWINDSLQVSEGMRKKPVDRDPNEVYGWQWTMNKTIPEIQTELPLKGVPADAFAARGHWGQSIAVVPSLDTVVVRVGDDRDGTTEYDKLLGLALEVAR